MPYSRRHYGLTPPPPQRWTTGRAASFADSLLGLENSTSAHTLWEDTISRSIHRSRPLWGAIRNTLVPCIDVLSPGGVWIGTSPGLNVDRDRFYPTLRRIV